MQTEFGHKIAENCVKTDARAFKDIKAINNQVLVQILEGACGRSVGGFRNSFKKAIAWMVGNGYPIHDDFKSPAVLADCPFDTKIMTNQNRVIDGWASDSSACISQLIMLNFYGKQNAYKFGKRFSVQILDGSMAPSDITKMMKNIMKNLVTDEGRRVTMRRDNNEQHGDYITQRTHGGIGGGVGVKDWSEALLDALRDPSLRSTLMDYLIDQGLASLYPDAVIEVTAIMDNGGNVSHAAKELGIDRAGIQKRWSRRYKEFLKTELTRLGDAAPRKWSEFANDLMLKKGSVHIALISIDEFSNLLAA